MSKIAPSTRFYPFILHYPKKYDLMRTFRLSLLCLFFALRPWRRSRPNSKTPPTKFRPDPLWFWNNTDITKEGIDAQMPGFLEKCGYGGLAILPFGPNLTPKYLTEEYFERYKYAVEKAAELGLTLSLYDEYGFPSGSGGAINADGVPRFRNRFPNLTMKRLDKIEEETRGGATYVSPVSKTGQLMAAVAMNADTKERIDLVRQHHRGNHRLESTRRELENHAVRLRRGRRSEHGLSERRGGQSLHFDDARGLLQTDARIFRKDDHFDLFRRTDAVPRAGPLLDADIQRDLHKKYGSSPALYYPALWYDIGPETQAARNALFGLRAELYAAAYPKAVSEWSKAHGIVATGHQDNEEIENPVGTSADLMKCFKYQDVPGIDKIGGDRPAEKFYKIVSSAAYNWDHSLVMSETYGAMGNIPWDTLYNVAMDQYSRGSTC